MRLSVRLGCTEPATRPANRVEHVLGHQQRVKRTEVAPLTAMSSSRKQKAREALEAATSTGRGPARYRKKGRCRRQWWSCDTRPVVECKPSAASPNLSPNDVPTLTSVAPKLCALLPASSCSPSLVPRCPRCCSLHSAPHMPPFPTPLPLTPSPPPRGSAPRLPPRAAAPRWCRCPRCCCAPRSAADCLSSDASPCSRAGCHQLSRG